jgi:hypothetical protein
MGLVLSKQSGAIGYLTMGRQPYDADAQAFFTAAGITDITQQIATNTFVIDLKGYNIWTKMIGLYPFVGGLATTHMYNLKDPRNLDAAYRLSFQGGWTHSSTGAKGGGSTNYADTFLTPNINIPGNLDFHYSVYSRTQVSAAEYEMGAINLGAGIAQTLSIYESGTVKKSVVNGQYPTHWANVNNSNTLGFLIGTRIATNNLRLHFNGSLVATNTNNYTAGLVNLKTYLGAINYSGGLFSTSKEISFASVGTGLTDTETANFYTAVQKFQTTLGRQV